MKDQRPTGERGVAYLRISDQAKQDERSQREEVQGWLDTRGLKATFIVDGGSRSLSYKRAGYAKLTAMIEAGQVDFLILSAADRAGLSSTSYELASFLHFCRLHQTEVWSVSGGLISDDSDSSVLNNAIGSQTSKRELLEKSTRAIRGKIAAVKRGEWPGGIPPWGYSLQVYGADGRKKHVLHWLTLNHRQKVHPDGRIEEYVGRRNVPGHDKGDVMRLTPSVDKDRVHYLRKLFSWAASEATTCRALAERLNTLGVKSNSGWWYSSLVRSTLSNRTYVTGLPIWNKRGRGSVTSWIGGEYMPVPRVAGRIKTGRAHPAADHVTADKGVQGCPLVDAGTFEKAQQMLQRTKQGKHAPRNPALWLSGYLFCGVCGQKMQGHASKKDGLAYSCSSFRKHGKHSGCKINRVRHELVESLLQKWLADAGHTIDGLLTINDEDQLVTALQDQHDHAVQQYVRLMDRVWRSVKDTAQPPPGKPWSYSSLISAAQRASKGSRGKLTAELKRLEGQMANLVDRFATLKGETALRVAQERIDTLEGEIAAVRTALMPIEQELTARRSELLALRDRLSSAREALRCDENRHKAQSLAPILSKVSLWFCYRKAGSLEWGRLSEAVFEPVMGEAVRLEAGHETHASNSPRGRASTAWVPGYLLCGYGPDTIDSVLREHERHKIEALGGPRSLVPRMRELRGQGLTHEEIGEQVGCSRRSVGRLLARA